MESSSTSPGKQIVQEPSRQPLNVSSTLLSGEKWYNLGRPSREISFNSRVIPRYDDPLQYVKAVSARSRGAIWPYSRVVTDVYSPQGLREVSDHTTYTQEKVPEDSKYRYLLDYHKYGSATTASELSVDLYRQTPFVQRPYSSVYSIERNSADPYVPVSLSEPKSARSYVSSSSIQISPGRESYLTRYAPRSYVKDATPLSKDSSRYVGKPSGVDSSILRDSSILTDSTPQGGYRRTYYYETGPYKSAATTHSFAESPYRYECVNISDPPNETRVIATGQYRERPHQYERYFSSYFPYYHSRVVKSTSTSTSAPDEKAKSDSKP